MAFLEHQAVDTDIFVFQEVLFGSTADFTLVRRARMNIFSEIQQRLSHFNGRSLLAPSDARHFESEDLPSDTHPGLAMFTRDTLSVITHGGFRTYQTFPATTILGGKTTGSCQWIEIQTDTMPITILNLHGLWQKDTKKADTPERLNQSAILNEFLTGRPGKHILCGDFNLVLDGKSMKLLEQNRRNLIKEFSISSTRSELYTKPVKQADYILVTPDIEVKTFSVLPDVVSDHLPLLLEFE